MLLLVPSEQNYCVPFPVLLKMIRPDPGEKTHEQFLEIPVFLRGRAGLGTSQIILL